MGIGHFYVILDLYSVIAYIVGMIARVASQTLSDLATQFKAVAVVGPRQSGKTTLVRSTFSDRHYVNLENPDVRRFAIEDPRGFLATYPDGAIFDEIQRVPELFSWLQPILDEQTPPGQFILTGSNNFLLQESISQSLAGRVGYLFLLPLSISEIGQREREVDTLLFKGGYPALYDGFSQPRTFYANYIRTYVERDVRLIRNISDLYTFERFVRLCAGRVGQLLNLSSLAIECGIDSKTAAAWIGILESSFIVFRLQPWHENFNKRIVKMPKLYFHDTGLASALLGLESADQWTLHPLRGAMFENLAVAELQKKILHTGGTGRLYFWRDSNGNEVDVIVDSGGVRRAVEIKSGMTVTNEYFKGIRYWNALSGSTGGTVIYGGTERQLRSDGIEVVGVVDV